MMYFFHLVILIVYCGIGFCGSDNFEEDFKRIYRCGQDECKLIENNFKKIKLKTPLVALVPSEEIDYNKGYVTVILRPMFMPWNYVGVQTDHCAFVAEYFERGGVLRRYALESRLVSLEAKPREEEANTSSSGNSADSISGVRNIVRVFNGIDVVDRVIWSMSDPVLIEKTYHRNLVLYYPYITFVVDKTMMKNVLDEVFEDSRKNTYDYRLTSNNCCNYVLNKIKSMGIHDLEYNTCAKDGVNPFFTSGQLKRACDLVRGKSYKGYEEGGEGKRYNGLSNDFRVYAHQALIIRFVDLIVDAWKQ